MQHLHVLLAPLLVFAVGLAWHHQVAARRNPARAGASGTFLAASFFPMVATGHLIQVVVEPSWRQLWVALHLVSAAAWISALVLHLVAAHRAAARTGTSQNEEGPEAAHSIHSSAG